MDGGQCVTLDKTGVFGVEVIAAIAALWVLSLLSVACALPRELTAQTEPTGRDAEKRKIAG